MCLTPCRSNFLSSPGRITTLAWVGLVAGALAAGALGAVAVAAPVTAGEPVTAGAALGATGRLAVVVGGALRQGWPTLLCAGTTLGVANLIVLLLRRHVPVGCGYAVAATGILSLLAALSAGALILSAG